MGGVEHRSSPAPERAQVLKGEQAADTPCNRPTTWGNQEDCNKQQHFVCKKPKGQAHGPLMDALAVAPF